MCNKKKTAYFIHSLDFVRWSVGRLLEWVIIFSIQFWYIVWWRWRRWCALPTMAIRTPMTLFEFAARRKNLNFLLRILFNGIYLRLIQIKIPTDKKWKIAEHCAKRYFIRSVDNGSANGTNFTIANCANRAQYFTVVVAVVTHFSN